MLKLSFRAIVIVVALTATPRFLWSQAAQHHFFVHGWSQGASAMSNLAGNMESRFGWTEDPTRPDYSNYGQYGIDF